MAEDSHGFSRAVLHCVGFLSSYDWELREPLMWPQGSPVSILVAMGCTTLLLSHSREIGPQDTLKKESQGLFRVAAGSPGFPQFVMVTSGSFSWCLWEVRYTVELGGASQDSTGVGAVEEGLISG